MMSAMLVIIVSILAVVFGGWILNAIRSLERPDGIVPDDEQKTYDD